MLVLSRKEGEKVLIDASIIVTVLRSANGKVRLGFEAPKEVSVVRTELLTTLPTVVNYPAAKDGGASVPTNSPI